MACLSTQTGGLRAARKQYTSETGALGSVYVMRGTCRARLDEIAMKHQARQGAIREDAIDLEPCGIE